MNKKVCIIGTGPAGLCAIKHSIAHKYEITAFEKQCEVGGTWNFTEETEVDKNGIDVHGSLYEGLMTNSPKEIMAIPGFPFPKEEERSFIPSDKVCNYFKSYAETFDLKKYVKLQHEVVRVRPLPKDMWEVIVRNIQADKFEYFKFDAVFICIGYSTPNYPIIRGQDIFKGKQLHSHNYRKPTIFEGETVLLMGSGPSGLDLALHVGKYAKKVFRSHHNHRTYGRDINIKLSDIVEEKPDISHLTSDSVVFVDGSVEKISMVVYATGYDFTYPFLSTDCGVSVEEKNIRPLFKHIININRPTMAFINIPFFALGNPMLDLQIRFVLKFWSSPQHFPTRDQMYEDLVNDEEARMAQNEKKRNFHLLGLERHHKYYDQLAKIADIEGIPPVLAKGFDENIKNLFDDFNNFKSYNFTIIDEEHFQMQSAILGVKSI